MIIDWLDLPELTTITSNVASETFRYPTQVTLDSIDWINEMMTRYPENSEYWTSRKNI